MARIRKEKDSLGFVEVPARAYYGAQTARAVANYPISGMRAHPLLIRAIGMVKRAAAETNKKLRLVDAHRADAISKAAQEVIDGKWDGEFVVDVFQAGAGVSFHMNANEVIANRANEILGGKRGEYAHVHPNDHVNYGQSTNDAFPTAMRLGTLLALEDLYPVLESLALTFEKKAKEFDSILKSGRTHLQDAVPIRLGQEFAAYAVAIRKARVNIAQQANGLRELGLGGSAVGTGINTHPRYRAEAIARLVKLSGQELTPAGDMRWAMQSNACMADVSAALRSLALEIIRISNDLRLLASGPNTGLAEIVLPSLQPGSSIMPGKINPVMAELAAMVSFQVIGNDTAVAYAVQAGQLELNVMMPTMAYNVLQSITILANMLRQFDKQCIAGITANAARCRMYAESTVSLATALNPYIGYAKAAEIVKESVATGRSIVELAREKKLLSEKEIAEILNPTRMTEPQFPLAAAKHRDPVKGKA
ncbi:MAG TPA: aspartate ammonia-lyase [Acidobacteriaceae bacterium]|nr:aspartate ammonia-lyase [Acidobacteriaceae bacterium]